MEKKKGGGSHQRDTNLAIESIENNLGKFKKCICPIHYNDGKGTFINADEFNRCGDSKDGLQAMCAIGKTQIDRFSHNLKRLLTCVAFYPEIIDNLLYGINEKISANIKEIIVNNININVNNTDPNYIYLFDQLSIIFNNAFTVEQIHEKTIKNLSILYRLHNLEKVLKSKNVGLYSAGLSLNDLERIDSIIKEKTNKILNEKLRNDILDVAMGFFTIESKDNNIFYEADSCPVNFSKLNDLYDKDKNKTIFKLNIHNTKEKGQRASTDRAYSYLADGNFTEANRYMKEIGQKNKKIHADHMVALRLGGIHDQLNLTPLSDSENLKKKDRLPTEIFLKLTNNLTLLSEYHRVKIVDWIKLNYNLILIEKMLRRSVEEQIIMVKNLPYVDKEKFLKKKYPYLKSDKIERLIKKYFE
jgi:hypothetical protein